ncbi:helix-turn-helix domain-containing protein [Thalassobaculum salexigens]|uniref:helix-turn-helix domain-containing protein n=1 Tax=Thalassobaculum salexigens TaxID=455360 RepID=UPI0012EB3F82
MTGPLPTDIQPIADGFRPAAVAVSGPNPELSVLFTGILNIEQAASMLHCSVDTLRRIDCDELPRYEGPGRKNLFMAEDLVRYIRRRRIKRPGNHIDVDRTIDRLLEGTRQHTRRVSSKGGRASC